MSHAPAAVVVRPAGGSAVISSAIGPNVIANAMCPATAA
jgi:hypothetical protein